MAMTPESGMEHDPRLAAAYRAGSGEEPPAHLDAAIRAAARREVGAAPGRVRARRWMVPLSLAAVMVLSVSVVLMMQQEGADQPDYAVRQLPREPDAAVTDAPATTNTVGKPAAEAQPQQTPAPPMAPPAIRAEPQLAPAAAPPPDLKQRADAGASPARETMAAPKAAEDARPAVSEAEARRERPVASPAPERALMRSAPTPGAAEAVTGAGPAGRRVPAQALADAPALPAALWRDLVDAPPAKWIERIAELRRDGRIADADTLAAEFRRRFPTERLPDHLR